MSYSNGLLQTKDTVVGRNCKDGRDGVGYKLSSDGNFDIEHKKIYNLKTQPDVAIDADYESYRLDLSSAVNKDYIKLNCLTKDTSGNDFDDNQCSINNSAPYYDGLYSPTTLTSKEYVDLKDTNLEQKIDTKLSVKADKQYSDDMYMTKSTGALLASSIGNKSDKSYVDNNFVNKLVGNGLAQSIQNRLNIHGSNMMQANLDMGGYNITHLKNPTNDTDAVNKKYMLDHVGESHVQSANGENKFKYIMDDPNAQVSEEDDVELGNVVTFQNSPHKIHQISSCQIATVL
ncbi:hypothetical protein ACROYT_G010481 [Oculina patagonica]